MGSSTEEFYKIEPAPWPRGDRWLLDKVNFRSDWHFVALEETAVFLKKAGIRPESIHVTGIPIDAVFSQQKDKQELRRKHNLDPNVTTVLISPVASESGRWNRSSRRFLKSTQTCRR